METAKREMTFLLANVERRALRSIAASLPRWVRSNHLSGVGVMAAVGAGAAYAASAADVRWLWAASLMLVVNWFGDSLDGTLARVRKAERPRYGYYLDHVIDAFSTAAVGIGVGLSPFVEIELALVLVVLYLMLSINVYLESAVFGVFRMAYGKIGPTEARLLLILANAGLALGSGSTVLGWLGGVRLTNGVAAILAASMLTLLAVRFAGNLRQLARLEPQRRLRSR